MAFTKWLSENHQPLLARVIVNRIWQYHFGQGLVRTPSDFGFNGDRPSHPELLDFLAAELIQHGWELKPIHRMILTSATYQQSSTAQSETSGRDAENRLCWRMAPRRLSAEELRDAILLVSGVLDDRHGGPGFRDVREYKYLGSHYYDPLEDPPEGPRLRRTIYRFSPRGAKRTMLDTFDCPDPSAKAPLRNVTVTPQQALSLLNNRFVLQMSDVLSQSLVRQHAAVADQIDELFLRVYGRSATNEEMSRCEGFVREHTLASLCRVLLNSNEFLHVR